MGPPLFISSYSPGLESMSVFPFEIFVSFHKRGNDRRWEGGLFHVHLFNVTSSEIQITAALQVNITIGWRTVITGGPGS